MTVIDSSVWVAFLNKGDSCHKNALNLLSKLSDLEIALYDNVYIEVLNVLRNKTSVEVCREFVKFLQDYSLEIIISDEHILSNANSYFFKYSKLSFSDAMILSASILSDSKLITFDKNLQKAWYDVAKRSRRPS